MEAGVRIRNTGTESVLQEHIRGGCEAYRSHGEHTGLDGPEVQFNQICECAELMGIRLQLSYDVPALKNLAMYPAEENCNTYLRRNGTYLDCKNAERQICCIRYTWDRKTPAKRNKP